jgi:predicted nucleic acid-binding protein
MHRATLPAGSGGRRAAGALAERLRQLFAERILVVGDAEATCWGDLAGRAELPVIDGLIAATALVHHLTLVSRNSRDFARTGARLLDPWQAA